MLESRPPALFLIFSVRQADWKAPTRERSHWQAFLELLTCGCTLLDYLPPIAPALQDYTVAGTALSPILTVDIPAIGPVSQEIFATCHQRKFTEVMFQDCSCPGNGLAVGAWCNSDFGLVQSTCAPPTPSQCTCLTKATAAKARPILTVGALVVCSDVLSC